MITPAAESPPGAQRWGLYLALLAAGLVAGFGGAMWSTHGGPRLPAVHVPVLGFVVAAAGALLWLRPRPLPYALGLLCLALAFAGFWLASPAGGGWTAAAILHEPGYGPYGGVRFGYLLLLFPVGWVLLAGSVARWRAGAGLYLLAGVAFALVLLLVEVIASVWGGPGFQRLPSPQALGILVLLWPQYVLTMLGVFGHTFG